MVLNNLGALGEAIADPYLRLQHPKSILCLPLASQRTLIGVLYMENSQTTNAFVSPIDPNSRRSTYPCF